MKRFLQFLLSFAFAIPGMAPAAAPPGALDPTFGEGGIQTYGLGQGLAEPGTALAKAPDGRLYMVGRVMAGSPLRQGIGFMRLLPNGEKDSTFGNGGRQAYTDELLGNLVVHDAAFQSNGKLIVAGEASTKGAQPEKGMLVCRFNLDGTPDEGFGGIEASPGCTFAKIADGAVAHALAIQPDGRIALAGWTYVTGKQRALIARVKTDGTFDASIGGSGFRMPFPSTDSSFRDVEVGPGGGGGRLVAVGERTLAGEPDYDVLVAQFTLSDGKLDPAFNPGSQAGRRTIAFNYSPKGRDRANAVKVSASGKIYAAGSAQFPGVTDLNTVITLVVLKSDGSDDAAFRDGGKTYYTACPDSGSNGNGGGWWVPSICTQYPQDLRLLDDGKLVMAGSKALSMFALRLKTDGDPDETFGSQDPDEKGFALVNASAGNAGSIANRIAVQGARVLLAGAAQHTPTDTSFSDFVIARLDHGKPDAFLVTPKVFPVGTGTTSPAAPQAVAHSGFAYFTVAPAAGHAVQNVTSNCAGALIGDVFVAGPITGNCAVNATFAADVTVTYRPGENGMLHWEQGYVQPGQEIAKTVPFGGSGPSIEAIPLDGYKFLKWSDGSIANPRVDANVTGSLSVTAAFVPKTYLVSQQLPAPAGGALMPASRVVKHGDHAPFTVLPDPGYGVASVSSPGCDGVLAGGTYVTGAVTADCQIDVDFVPSDAHYTLTYRAGPQCEIEGAVDGVLEQEVASGYDGAAVKVAPKPGSQFVGWSDNFPGVLVGETAVRTDTHVFGHLDVTAQCASLDAAIHSVTPVYGKGGALDPHSPTLVADGNSLQFTLLPAAGYAIDTIAGCNGGALDGNVYTTAPITADCEIHAAFVASDVQYQLRYAAGAGGALDGVAEQSVISGGSGTAVEAIAHPGHFFVQWSDGSTDNPRRDENVVADVDVVAQFAAEGQLIVTPSAGAGGSISPSLAQVVAPGAVLQFVVTPDPAFGIAGVSGCGGTLQGKLYTTAPIQASCHVQAHFAGSDASYWLTYAAGAHGSLEGQLVQQVTSGESGSSVLAKPDPGYQFLQWSDGSTDNPRVDSGVVADLDVTAEFAASGSLIVTPSAGVGGSIVPGVKQVASPGQVLQFGVLPDAGFTVAAVGGDCGGSLQGNVYTTAPISASCSIEASFAASEATYTLKYVAGPNGKVDGQAEVSQQVPSGASGSAVEAQPAAGHFFVQWSDGSTANPRTDAHVVADLEVTAQFAQNGGFVVKPVAGPGGSLSPGLAQVVTAGSVVEFGVHPDDGFLVDEVHGCGGSLNGNVYVTAAVQANCEVQASFVASDQQFQLTYLAGPNGSVVGAVQQSVPAGADGEPVTAVPANGHFFVKWSDGRAESERTDTDVSADLTVSAEFAAIGTPVHTVTPIAGPGGAFWPAGPLNVVDGDNAVFTVKPDPGFAIDEVVGCGGTLVGNQYVTAPVLADCDVQASFVASAQTFVLTYRAGANGLVNGQAEISTEVGAGGAGPVVAAQPASGFEFVQWSDGSVANPRQDQNVAADVDVTAEFAAEGTTIHRVVPLSGEGGALVPPVQQHVAHGDSAVFEVVPNEGYAIASVGGSCGGELAGNQYVTAPVTADCTVEATFQTSSQVFSLVYNAGPHGRVNGQAAVAQNVVAGGSGPMVEAQPDAGYQFLQWSDGMPANPRQDTNVTADLEATAQFAPIGATLYTVTPIASAGGGLSPGVPMQVAAGEKAEFTLLPNAGYGIQSVASSCGGALAGDVFTTEPVHANCTVEAAFFDDRIFASGFDSGQ